VNFILSILVPILGFLLIGVINNVVGVFQGLSNFIMGFVQIVTAIFTGFGEFFTKLFQGDIGGALGALGTMFASIWDGIVKMLQGALEFLWNAVQLLFIGKLIGGIKTGLTSIGAFFKSAWDDIVNGVRNAFTTMQSRVSSGIDAIRTFFSNGWNNMVSMLQTAWSNIVSAVSTGVGNVMNWVSGIPGKIGGALSGLGNLLTNAGRAIIDGLLAGLKAAWGAVTSFVGGIADWIAKNKGPLPYDRQLLVPAGKAIMDGLGNGLESKLSMLKGVLDTVTSTMEDSVTEAFAKSRMYVAGADAALGLADGLASKKSAVADALSSVMPASTSASLNLSGTGGAGVGVPTPGVTKIVNIEAGAIPVTTPTKNPELVAAKVIDEFAGFSNF
jgi:phage-related protein